MGNIQIYPRYTRYTQNTKRRRIPSYPARPRGAPGRTLGYIWIYPICTPGGPPVGDINRTLPYVYTISYMFARFSTFFSKSVDIVFRNQRYVVLTCIDKLTQCATFCTNSYILLKILPCVRNLLPLFGKRWAVWRNHQLHVNDDASQKIFRFNSI